MSSEHLSIRQVDNDTPQNLTGSIVRQNLYPLAHGGFSDVWAGILDDGHSQHKVAVKVLRPQTYEDAEKSKIDRRLRRELRVWTGLHHENIIPMLGTVSDFGPYLSMVCPWMENGSLTKYIEQHNSLTIDVRLQLLYDVAAGLHYLHSSNIVHGDLTGANVLISKDGKACLSDFGLSMMIAEFQGTSYCTSSMHGNLRWSAPELYRMNPIPSVTTYSDIYSFGSVMLQILSGRTPYHYLKSDVQVLIHLLNRMLPQRPGEPPITDLHWGFIQRCWVSNPRARPMANEVLGAIDYFRSNTTTTCNSSRSSVNQILDAATGPSPMIRMSVDGPLLSKQLIQPQHSTKVQPVWAISPRVLLVDDDAVIRKLSIRLLQVYGCIIDVAVDGAAAVNKMNLATYDLVFMDIMMPRLDGITATSLIRKFDLLTPIISMTSNSGQTDIQTYYTSGMNDVLCKPFGKEGILTILEKHLVHLRQMVETPEPAAPEFPFLSIPVEIPELQSPSSKSTVKGQSWSPTSSDRLYLGCGDTSSRIPESSRTAHTQSAKPTFSVLLSIYKSVKLSVCKLLSSVRKTGVTVV